MNFVFIINLPRAFSIFSICDGSVVQVRPLTWTNLVKRRSVKLLGWYSPEWITS